MNIEGACHCGAISFTAEVDPDRVIVCHCSDCQVLSGAPFRAVVPAPVSGFVLRGTPKHYLKTAASGNRRVQAFCPECATPLYAAAPEGGTHVNLRLGCVSQRHLLPPKAQIWCRSAQPWLEDLSGLPGSPDQSPPVAPRPQGSN